MPVSVVETASGKVQGTVEDGVAVFRGIPFAAPPVGELRFRPPQPAAPWPGTLEATAFGQVSMQTASPLETMLGAQALDMSEDCLSLNVWTPAADGAKRPVMVWIHGGAFVTGSGSTPWYDGTKFARNTDVVLVTVNYRLGALGFLHLDDIGGESFGGSGNLGILDQVAALEWVRDNIEAFGGDPNNVTAFGESAGAMSVGTLLGLPAAKGLFVKAIPQSGAAHNGRTPEKANEITVAMFEELGLPLTPAGAEQLRTVDTDKLLAAQAAVSMRFVTAGLGFAPVVDGVVLPEAPIDAIGGGSAAGVSVLLGSNKDEWKLFTMLDPSLGEMDEAKLRHRVAGVLGDDDRANALVDAYRSTRPNATAAELWTDMQGDYIFRIPAIRLAERQSALGNPVHMYLFTWPTPVMGGALGSCHALEIPFVFDNLDQPGANMFTGGVDDGLRSLASTMHHAWASFARTGTPVADGMPDWPTYTADNRATMIFDVERRIEDDPGSEDRQAWDGLL
ncbi:MAG: carboxylesterase/lipase family protein [Actinobacteria bacterium]|nr:carboxylesterase/lipase family protein [Actinomycetota bacterium]